MKASEQRKRMSDEALKLINEAQQLRDQGDYAGAEHAAILALETVALATQTAPDDEKAMLCRNAAVIAFSLGDADKVHEWVDAGLACDPPKALATELKRISLHMIQESYAAAGIGMQGR